MAGDDEGGGDTDPYNFMSHAPDFVIRQIWAKPLSHDGFRDIQWRMWRNYWHDLKRTL